MELSVNRAARVYPISRRALRKAIQRGALPVHVVPVLEVRVHSKDVEAYLKAVPAWRRLGKRHTGSGAYLTNRAPAAVSPDSPTVQEG